MENQHLDNVDFKRAVIARLTSIENKQDKTNGRVREVELWKARATGFGIAVSLGASLPGVILAFLLLTEKAGA